MRTVEKRIMDKLTIPTYENKLKPRDIPKRVGRIAIQFKLSIISIYDIYTKQLEVLEYYGFNKSKSPHKETRV